MTPTDEQQAIVKSQSPFLKVHGFAGATKTTTLVMRAQARPRSKILYLAFNKAIQLEAKERFPSHVKCVTSHGLAFPQFGSLYNDSSKITPRLRVNEVVNALDLKKYPEDFALYVADAAMKTVDRYLASAEPTISENFCRGLITPQSGVEAGDIVALAEKLWTKMCDLKDGSIGMVHDGYLKLYQLSNPKLRYDEILFDEFQDANPVTVGIFDSQEANKTVVGDEHQQLYSFRGATNAMHSFEAHETLYLTKSFRFGQEIADVANLVLKSFKGEKKEISGTSAQSQIGHFSPSLPVTIIARANGTLFSEAADAIKANKKIAFVGGIAGYRVSDALDAYNLWSGNSERVVNPYIKSFQQFDRMDDYSGAVDDKELRSLIGLVKKHGSKLPRMVASIKSSCVEDLRQAQTVLTTGHKAKGLEFDNVRLTDDYIDLIDDKGRARILQHSELEEVNIVYVALSRAKKKLAPFPDLTKLIDIHKAEVKNEQLPHWAKPLPNSPSRIFAKP